MSGFPSVTWSGRTRNRKTRSRLLLALALALSVSLGLSASGKAAPLPGPWLSLVYDPALGVEAGVLTVHSLSDLLSLYDTGLSRAIGWAPTTTGGRILGIAGRMMQSFFVDVTVTQMERLLIHEVFGHGARSQPWGTSPSYSFHTPFPWGLIVQDHSTHGAHTDDADDPFRQRERTLPMLAGGIEAENYSAYRIGLDAVRLDGRFPHSRQLFYLTVKSTYIFSLAAPSHADAATGDDVATYTAALSERFNRWRPSDRESVADHIRYAYIGNFVDPTLWLALYGYVVEYLVRGNTEWRLPMLHAGPVSLYAATRFVLSPFGAEHYLDLFARWRGRTFTVYGRAVSSGLAMAWGAGLKALDLMRIGGLGMGVEIDAWQQPEMLFDPSYVNVFERPSRGGVSLALDLDWKIAWRLGVTGKLGWKTDGWLMGQPLAEGPYGWVGLAVYADADGALFKLRP